MKGHWRGTWDAPRFSSRDRSSSGALWSAERRCRASEIRPAQIHESGQTESRNQGPARADWLKVRPPFSNYGQELAPPGFSFRPSSPGIPTRARTLLSTAARSTSAPRGGSRRAPTPAPRAPAPWSPRRESRVNPSRATPPPAYRRTAPFEPRPSPSSRTTSSRPPVRFAPNLVRLVPAVPVVVPVVVAAERRRAIDSASIHLEYLPHSRVDPRLRERPVPHVLGLLLAPHELGVWVPRQSPRQRGVRERRELLQTDQRHVVGAVSPCEAGAACSTPARCTRRRGGRSKPSAFAGARRRRRARRSCRPRPRRRRRNLSTKNRVSLLIARTRYLQIVYKINEPGTCSRDRNPRSGDAHGLWWRRYLGASTTRGLTCGTLAWRLSA